MNCKTCNQPVEIGQAFVSGFDDQFSVSTEPGYHPQKPEKVFFLQHAKCAGVNERQAKVMNALRVESIEMYQKAIQASQPKV